MDRENQKKPESKPKPYSIERLPTGEKVMRIRGRKHGQKLDVKLTLDEIKELFLKA